MDASYRYATRLRVAQETNVENHNGTTVTGKRAMRQSQRVGGVGAQAKRALGDITNNISAAGTDRFVSHGKKAGAPVPPNTLNLKLAQQTQQQPPQQQPQQPASRKSLQAHALLSTSTGIPKAHDETVVRRDRHEISRVLAPVQDDWQVRRCRVTATRELDNRLAEMELKNIVDIDARDRHDHLCCTEYVKEIYDNWRKKEKKLLPQPDYMAMQPDISDKMRSILIDWLVDVHQKFKLSPDTLYLTVSVVDRFLSKEQVVRQKLQLVGVTSMLIASKYHEIYAPETNDFVFISDSAYTREEILKMEAVVLNTLGFRVTSPSPAVFLDRYLKAAEANKKTASYANFCLEMAQQEYRLVGLEPSKIAAAACLLAGKQSGTLVWNETMEHYTKFTESELESTLHILYNVIASTKPRLTAIRRKYAQVKYCEVAKLELLPVEMFCMRTRSSPTRR